MWPSLIAFITASLYFLYQPKWFKIGILGRILIGTFCLWFGLAAMLDSFWDSQIKLSGLGMILIALFVLAADAGALLFLEVGNATIFQKSKSSLLPDTYQELFRGLLLMARKKIGALILITRKDELEDHLLGYVPFEAQVKAEILIALFVTSSPVHDGAVVVSDKRIQKVKGILPIKTNQNVPLGVGTRHRSAIGITEKTDAVAFVVSEERGEISVAYGGKLMKNLSESELNQVLKTVARGKPPQKIDSPDFSPADAYASAGHR